MKTKIGAGWAGLGKDAAMRPPSGDKEALLPISKLAKVIKRKRASDSEGQKPKKRAARKPKGNKIPLTMESVQRLRDEKEEEEEEEGLVARARANTDIQKTSELVGVDTSPSRLNEVEEETLAQVPEPRGTEDTLPRGEESIEEAMDADTETGLEARREGGSTLKNLLGVIEIGDSPSFPSFSQWMIRDAQDVETCHGEGAHEEEDPFRGCFVGVEDVTGLSDLVAPKKSSGEAGVSCLFNETQQALNRAFVLHHEVFLRSREEMSRYEAEIRALTEERDAFKLLSEQREVEVEELRAELEVAQREQADLSEQLRVEVDAVKAEVEEWKKNMDRLASEKVAARAQLASAETQLRVLKEKALVQAKKIEEFQSRLGSETSDQERLSTELAEAKSEVEIDTVNADAMVVVYRYDDEDAQVRAKEVVEAAQAQANWVAEYAKCHSRRETLEEIHARGFDLIAEIENAKKLEAEARVLAFSDDDNTGSMSGSEGEGGLEGKYTAPRED
uniref:Uncharacterized protein n=1 Tax=Nicotiana tabacum TaxID=4097 RepID=A0A1S3WZI4_TOBAC|nr:PREDICTED: uncharacterized protein LOC107759586 [Nicotiana tabacum]